MIAIKYNLIQFNLPPYLSDFQERFFLYHLSFSFIAGFVLRIKNKMIFLDPNQNLIGYSTSRR